MKHHKKKRKEIRTRDWEHDDEAAFSHELARHRKALVNTNLPVIKAGLPDGVEPNGLVVSHSGKWAFVKVAGEERICLIGELLASSAAALLAPGDAVLVQQSGDDWVVCGMAERRTKLSRLVPDRFQVREQVIAANVDLMVIVAATAKPMLKAGLIDRYLVAAQIGGVAPVLCINKMDLVTQEPARLSIYRELGIPIICTSCITGTGIETLREHLAGKLSVVAGQSGVGKSSILNALDPALELHTLEVSSCNEKGRHATTSARLYELAGGIRVIDTPGIRQLALWGVTHDELAFYFPEMEGLAGACRFRDCTHTHEPDCAVLSAVETGELLRPRYESYLRIRESIEERAKRF